MVCINGNRRRWPLQLGLAQGTAAKNTEKPSVNHHAQTIDDTNQPKTEKSSISYAGGGATQSPAKRAKATPAATPMAWHPRGPQHIDHHQRRPVSPSSCRPSSPSPASRTECAAVVHARLAGQGEAQLGRGRRGGGFAHRWPALDRLGQRSRPATRQHPGRPST